MPEQFAGSELKRLVLDNRTKQMIENINDALTCCEWVYGAEPDEQSDNEGWTYCSPVSMRDFYWQDGPKCIAEMVEDMRDTMIRSFAEYKLGEDARDIIEEQDDEKAFCQEIWRYAWNGPDEPDYQLMLPGFTKVEWWETKHHKQVERFEQKYIDSDQDCIFYRVDVNYDTDEQTIEFVAGVDTDVNYGRRSWGARISFTRPLNRLTPLTFAAFEKLAIRMFDNA